MNIPRPTPQEIGRNAVHLHMAMKWMQARNVDRVDRAPHEQALAQMLPVLQGEVAKACGE